VLQAADILLYDTEVVPVGEDQVQHIELTRDVAQRFNHMFGETFVLPRAEVPRVGARIMGFDDPTVKMSKSLAAERPGHAIELLDDPDTVKRVIMSAVTDSGRELRFEHASPGVKNLMTIAHVATGKPVEAIEAELEGGGYGTLKKLTVEAVNQMLAPLQARYREYMDDPASLDAVLARGAERASEVAARTLKRAQEALGVG
jgi:tryptophanyl-tRNA synthetase